MDPQGAYNFIYWAMLDPIDNEQTVLHKTVKFAHWQCDLQMAIINIYWISINCLPTILCF